MVRRLLPTTAFGRSTPSAVIATDLLLFAKLAVLREVVPYEWSWEGFLEVALVHVGQPFADFFST